MYQAMHHFYKLCNISHDESPSRETREFFRANQKEMNKQESIKSMRAFKGQKSGFKWHIEETRLRVLLENTSRVTCITDENSFSSIQILSKLGLGLFIFILHI